MSASHEVFAAEGSTESWPNLLCQVAQEVFSMMVGVNLTVPAQVEAESSGEVTGMVGLAGALCGVLTVRCTKSASIQIASRMLGFSEEEATLHMSDAIGEVCNMVAGGFKAKINGLEDKCMLSVPTVITGDNYTTHAPIVGNRIEVQLLFHNEPLWIMLETRG